MDTEGLLSNTCVNLVGISCEIIFPGSNLSNQVVEKKKPGFVGDIRRCIKMYGEKNGEFGCKRLTSD